MSYTNRKIKIVILLRCVVFLLVYMVCLSAFSQVLITGKISDASTSDAIPDASVGLRGTSNGTTTNFDGQFSFQLRSHADSITVSCVGYLTQTAKIGSGIKQIINLRLQPSALSLKELVIRPGQYINPAWEILQEIVRHKPENDPSNLQSYEYHA